MAPSIAALSKHAFITIYDHAYIWCFAEYAPDGEADGDARDRAVY